MNAFNPMRAAILVACALLLGACQMTVVETLPEGAHSNCPSEWPGAWIALDDHMRPDPEIGMVIDAACTIAMVASDPKDVPADLRLKPRFLDQPGISVVLFEHAEIARLIELKADDAEKPQAGWWPFQWARADDTLLLHAPEHRRIATLIVNAAIDGATHWSGRDSGFNVLQGTPAQLRTRLLDDRLFARDTPMRFERVGDDRRALDRALKQAARDAQRRSKGEKRSK